MAIILLFLTVIIGMTIEGSLVGIAFFVIFRHRINHAHPFSKWNVFAMFFIIALLNVLYVPMIAALGVEIRINNSEVASILGKAFLSTGDLIDMGLYDAVTWVVEAFLGIYVGSRVNTKYFEKDQ